MIQHKHLDSAIDQLATSIIESSINSMVNKATKAAQKILRARKAAYKKYLTSSCKQYCWQKTFLNKQAPQYIYDFYVPLKLRVVAYKQVHGTLSYNYLANTLRKQVKDQRIMILNKIEQDSLLTEPDTIYCDTDDDIREYQIELESRGYHNESESIGNTYEGLDESIEDIPPHYILSGQAGCGKSTVMRHLFLDAIKSGITVPILVELRDRNDSKTTVWSIIVDQVSKRDNHFDDDAITDAFAKGLILLLIDGLDEVDSSYAIKAEKEILDIAESFPDTTIVLSSRPYTEFSNWHTFLELELLPLDIADAEVLVKSAPIDKTIIRKFIRDLKANMFNREKSFLSNPLLLSIMILTYNETADIPNRLHNFYEQAYYALFNRHDASKGAYTRERLSMLAVDEFASLLDAFCIITYCKNKTKFTTTDLYKYLGDSREITKRRITFDNDSIINDLRKALGLLVPQGEYLVFSHRSFQEYFAACYLASSDVEEAKSICEFIEVRVEQDSVLKMFADLNPILLERAYVVPVLSEILDGIEYQGKVTNTIYVRYLQKICDRISIGEDAVIVSGHIARVVRFIRKQYEGTSELPRIFSKELDADAGKIKMGQYLRPSRATAVYDPNEMTSRHRAIPLLKQCPSVASEATIKFLAALRKKLIEEDEARPRSFSKIIGR